MMAVEKTWNAGEVVSIAAKLTGGTVAITTDTIDSEGVLGPLDCLEFPASMLSGLLKQLLDVQNAAGPKEEEAY